MAVISSFTDLSIDFVTNLLNSKENVVDKINDKPKGGDIILCRSVPGTCYAYGYIIPRS